MKFVECLFKVIIVLNEWKGDPKWHSHDFLSSA